MNNIIIPEFQFEIGNDSAYIADDEDGGYFFDIDLAVSQLLALSILSIGSLWHTRYEIDYGSEGVAYSDENGKFPFKIKDDPIDEDISKLAILNVNCNDVLMWGAADSESLNFDDIRSLYDHVMYDSTYGSTIWFCKRVKMMPQKPIADQIRKAGKWNLDDLQLDKNPTDDDF